MNSVEGDGGAPPRSSSEADATLPVTERANPASRGIDTRSAVEICAIIHAEDERTWRAVGGATESIARVVDRVVTAFRQGGRLLYVGAGTSGRLGLLDAAECPPTFGVPPELVRAVIAGGDAALTSSVEGAEDSVSAGSKAIVAAAVAARDVVCGIAASGSTPFVIGALEAARACRSTTVLITCNPGWRAAFGDLVEWPIVLDVGAEIIAGSTRMKAGTATKMTLNMITTAAMVRWGKVYDNLMVDVRPVNRKLRLRAIRLVGELAAVDAMRARQLLEIADWQVKVAVVMGRKGQAADAARAALARCGGSLRGALG